MSEQKISEYYKLFGNLNSSKNTVITVYSPKHYCQKLQRVEGDPINPKVNNTLIIEMKENYDDAGFIINIKLKEGVKNEQILDLHSPLARELINKLMCDSFMTVDGNNLEGKGTGYLLAITYIQSQSSSINKVFYTAIGESLNIANSSDNTRIFRRNIMADLINSIKEAKKLNKPTTTLFVTSRGGIKSHDFCVTVNTDIFDNDGIIKNVKN